MHLRKCIDRGLSRWGSGPGGGRGVLSTTSERATRAQLATAVAARVEHRCRAESDVATSRPRRCTLQTTQVIHTDRVGSGRVERVV